jgi:hypothetical protein
MIPQFPPHHPMTTTPLSCDGSISDDVLQAARKAMPANAGQLPGPDWQPLEKSCGTKNAPLIMLLEALIDAATTTARAIADNAWDDSLPLPRSHAETLANACYRIGADITNATQCPDARTWSLPSMTGKELV